MQQSACCPRCLDRPVCTCSQFGIKLFRSVESFQNGWSLSVDSHNASNENGHNDFEHSMQTILFFRSWEWRPLHYGSAMKSRSVSPGLKVGRRSVQLFLRLLSLRCLQSRVLWAIFT